jgi:hypothetical protein
MRPKEVTSLSLAKEICTSTIASRSDGVSYSYSKCGKKCVEKETKKDGHSERKKKMCL